MVKVFKPKTAKKKHDTLIKTVIIDHLDDNGVGVSRQTAPVTFVRGALPGERCKVEVPANKASFHHGKLIEIVDASSERLTPFCPHYSSCGGCQTQHIPPAMMIEQRQNALSVKLEKLGFADNNLWQAPLLSDATHYRRKARLAVDARNAKQIKVGFKSGKTNQIVNVDQCQILTLHLQDLLSPIHGLIKELAQPSAISHISLFEADNTVQTIFRVVKTLSNSDRALLETFSNTHQLTTLLHKNNGQFETLINAHGEPSYAVGASVKLDVGPEHFIQVNQSINTKMIAQAFDWLALSESDYLLDLFCGLGNFSIAAAKQCAHVTGVEGIESMVEQAKHNAHINQVTNANFFQLDLSEKNVWNEGLGKINKVLLDPSRIGALNVVENFPKTQIKSVVYVSCNPATFMRDAKVLLEKGMKLRKLGLIDMFPCTSHSEIMGLFER